MSIREEIVVFERPSCVGAVQRVQITSSSRVEDIHFAAALVLLEIDISN